MIFVDSNIPMYLVGADHPNKRDAQRLVEKAVLEGRALVTDAEVYQEILHRYSAIRRLDAITPAFETLDAMVDEVTTIGHADVKAARDVLLAGHATSARDAVHLAVMRRLGCTEILTFDRAFDEAVGVQRVR